jgi:hypothetical protein
VANSPIGGTQRSVPLITALLIVGVLLAESFIVTTANLTMFAMTAPRGWGILGPLSGLIEFVPFGIGVFVSLRYVAPIQASSSWGSIVVRAIIAAALGVAAVFVVGAVQAAILTIGPGAQPFGYSFPGGGSVNYDGLPYRLASSASSALSEFFGWLPLVVVAGIFQKLWLASRGR